MWSTLAGDLNEFVSTVAGDTAEALNRMDENFPDGAKEAEQSPAAEERLRRMEMRETFGSPLISDDDDEDYKKDVESFLSEFSVEDKTDDIAKLLEENPDTLKLAFEALVPTKVTYDEFWKRYFYRCDEDRIQAEIEQEEKEAEEARAEAFKSISAVGNLLGGAVKAVSASLKDDGTGQTGASNTSFQMTKNQAEKAGIFGASGRPPFVLNTAVSEGDDDEEELGWDDDEEDDDEEEGDEEEDAGEGQIEFNDAVTEKLQEQLKLAIDERDQLHATVEMQQKEIASLKSEGAESKEMENLKTQLFEKESEVAALRASSMDEDSSALAGEKKDSSAEIKVLEAKVEILAKQAEEDKKVIESERKKNEDLTSQVSALESDVKASTEEVLALKSEKLSLQSKFEEAEKRAQALEGETRKLEEMLRQKEDAVGEASVGSPETNASSGVKVEAEEEEDTPTPTIPIPEPASTEAAGADGDGWDDDW